MPPLPSVALVLSALALAPGLARSQQSVPEIPFSGNVDFLAMPATLSLGEVAGVAVNSTGHVFVFTRSGERSTVHGATASQLFEFDRTGRFIREIGKDLYGFAFAHTVRIDRDDNIWATDEGTNMIIRFNPAGRVTMVLGREGGSGRTSGPARSRSAAFSSRMGGFNRPTDVAWDVGGNLFVADGYGNSRVVKIDPHGRWVKAWGDRGTDPGQFNTLHAIASDVRGNIYVGDRGNRRIQVFDSDGKFLRQFTIDVPFAGEPNVMVGAMPGSGGDPLAQSGAPWAMCISPAPHQFLFVADAVPGRIYKLTLEGTVVGVLGGAGKEAKQFGWIHELACPSDHELYAAELLNWRVQKLTLR